MPSPLTAVNDLGPGEVNKTREAAGVRVVQLNFSQENQVFYMKFERTVSIFRMTSVKLHIKYMYFHFRCKIQLDIPVLKSYVLC